MEGQLLITITGASGVGKTTIMRHIMNADKSVIPLKSTTTRKPRMNDVDGEYEYITESVFRAMNARDVFLWTVNIHGNLYGTRKKIIRAALHPRFKVIAPIVHDAVSQLRAFAREHEVENQVRSAYILSPGRAILRERLENRDGHSMSDVERRLNECLTWDEEAANSDVSYIFFQDKNDIEEKVARVKNLLAT